MLLYHSLTTTGQTAIIPTPSAYLEPSATVCLYCPLSIGSLVKYEHGLWFLKDNGMLDISDKVIEEQNILSFLG